MLKTKSIILKQLLDEAEHDMKNCADRGQHPSRKPNSMIVLLFIQNISRALRKTKFTLLSFVTNFKIDNIK